MLAPLLHLNYNWRESFLPAAIAGHPRKLDSTWRTQAVRWQISHLTFSPPLDQRLQLEIAKQFAYLLAHLGWSLTLMLLAGRGGGWQKGVVPPPGATVARRRKTLNGVIPVTSKWEWVILIVSIFFFASIFALSTNILHNDGDEARSGAGLMGVINALWLVWIHNLQLLTIYTCCFVSWSVRATVVALWPGMNEVSCASFSSPSQPFSFLRYSFIVCLLFGTLDTVVASREDSCWIRGHQLPCKSALDRKVKLISNFF